MNTKRPYKQGPCPICRAPSGFHFLGLDVSKNGPSSPFPTEDGRLPRAPLCPECGVPAPHLASCSLRYLDGLSRDALEANLAASILSNERCLDGVSTWRDRVERARGILSGSCTCQDPAGDGFCGACRALVALDGGPEDA